MSETDQTCPAVGYQKVAVCVPVTVKPFANTKPTITTCCGDPIVISGDTPPCAGKKNGTCQFKITQLLCVAVPVEFGAKAEVGDTFVDCLGATETPCPECND